MSATDPYGDIPGWASEANLRSYRAMTVDMSDIKPDGGEPSAEDVRRAFEERTAVDSGPSNRAVANFSDKEAFERAFQRMGLERKEAANDEDWGAPKDDTYDVGELYIAVPQFSGRIEGHYIRFEFDEHGGLEGYAIQ
jgi:hypothetical protein